TRAGDPDFLSAIDAWPWTHAESAAARHPGADRAHIGHDPVDSAASATAATRTTVAAAGSRALGPLVATIRTRTARSRTCRLEGAGGRVVRRERRRARRMPVGM